MIEFGFDTDDGAERIIYWLGTTACTGEDEQHADEIYEQLDAITSGLA